MKRMCLLFLLLAGGLSAADPLATVSSPPNPADFLEIDPPRTLEEQNFQHRLQEPRAVTIRGVKVVIDLRDTSTPVSRAILGKATDGFPVDLKELSISAQTVVIRGRTWLPGTNVSIDASEVRFEDEGDTIATLVTTPLPHPEDAGTEAVATMEYLNENRAFLNDWAFRYALHSFQSLHHLSSELLIAHQLERFGDGHKARALKYNELLKEGPIDLEEITKTWGASLTDAQYMLTHFVDTRLSEVLDVRTTYSEEDPEAKAHRLLVKGHINSIDTNLRKLIRAEKALKPHEGWEAKRDNLRKQIREQIILWSLWKRSGRNRGPSDFLTLPSSLDEITGKIGYLPDSLTIGKAGAEGLPAGRLQVHAQMIVAEGDTPRFILDGGTGQTAGNHGELPKEPGWDFYIKRIDEQNLRIAKNRGAEETLPPTGPLFTVDGKPVMFPIANPYVEAHGQRLDLRWVFKGRMGIDPALSGSGGKGGDIVVSGAARSEILQRVKQAAGENGTAKKRVSSPPLLDSWYELVQVPFGVNPPPSAKILNLPGVTHPGFAPDTATEWLEGMKTVVQKDREQFGAAYFYAKEHGVVSPKKGDPPLEGLPIPGLGDVKWRFQPRRLLLVKRTPNPSPTDAATPKPGTPGLAVNEDVKAPDVRALGLAVSWIRELYLGGHREEAMNYCIGLLDRFATVGASSASEQVLRDEVERIARNLAEDRDYFGNPPGWTPAGSLDLMLRSYRQTVERSVQSMVMAAYLEKAWSDKASRPARREAMLSHFSAQQENALRESRHLDELILKLEAEMKRGREDLDALLQALKASEESLVEDVKLREEFRHEVLKSISAIGKFTENFAGVSADAFSELAMGSGVGSALGYGLDIVNSGVGAAAEAMRYDITSRPVVPEGRVTAYFERMLEAEDVRDARQALQEIDPLKVDAARLYQKLDRIIPPLAAASLRSIRGQLKQQLSSPEGTRLFTVMFEDKDPYAPLQNGTLETLSKVIGVLDTLEEKLKSENDSTAKKLLNKTLNPLAKPLVDKLLETEGGKKVKDFLDDKIKGATGGKDPLASIASIDIINPRMPETMALLKEGISTKTFSEQFALITWQLTYRGMVESKLAHARMLKDAADARVKNLADSIGLMKEDGEGPMNALNLSDSLLESVRSMRREAEDRLLFQKYCLVQAYQHRLLKPCEVQHPLSGKRPVSVGQSEVMRQTQALLDLVFNPKPEDKRLRESLGKDWSSYLEGGPEALAIDSLPELAARLKVLHEKDLHEIAQAIIDEMLLRRGSEVEPRRTELTAEELDQLNRFGQVTIDLTNRRLFYPEDRNTRLIAVHFQEPGGGAYDQPRFGKPAWFFGAEEDPAMLNLRLTVELHDSSEILWNGKTHRFNYAQSGESKPVVASFTYNPAGSRLHRSKPLEADSSLLMEAFGFEVSEKDAHRLKTYRGARTKLTLRKQLPEGVPADLPIEKLVLWIEVAAQVGSGG